MDSSAALYEWNYPAQMLELRRGGERSVDLYDESFLIERPLLAALRAPAHTLLLIDEIDRSDHEFEAFLLEFLSDFQISIPEIGTLRAEAPPVVVLTSNRPVSCTKPCAGAACTTGSPILSRTRRSRS